jgi:hypothetical protein
METAISARKALLSKIALGVALLASSAAAQDPTARSRAPTSQNDDWQFTLALPIWMASTDAHVHTDRLDVDSSVSFADTLEDLELGLMLAGGARKGRLTLDTALLWTRVSDESDVTVGPGVLPLPPVDVDVELDQVILEALVGWTVSDWPLSRQLDDPRRVVVDVRAGVRYWYVGTEVDAKLDFGPPLPLVTREIDDELSFADVVIGGRVHVDMTPRLAMTFAGDYGGFGFSSDSTWMWSAQLWWEFGTRWQAFLGYRMQDVERDDGDVQLRGPTIGIAREF